MAPAYTPKDYPKIRAASKDWMPQTFDEWRIQFDQDRMMEGRRSRLSGINERTPHVRVKPELLADWLSANGLESTAETRTHYATSLGDERLRRLRDAALQASYDPRMPIWANKLQKYLADWWKRHGF